MSIYEQRYGAILQDIARGRGELTGLPPEFPGFPRFEHASIAVKQRKGGLFSKGGTESSDNLMLDLLLGVGFEIVSIESHPEFMQFHLQRRHEHNCVCANCAEWNQFRARLT